MPSIRDLLREVGLTDEGVVITGELMGALNEVINSLSPRSSEVLRRFYGIGCEHTTLKALGIELSVSASRVSAIRDQALRRMRVPYRMKVLEKAVWVDSDPKLRLLHEQIQRQNMTIVALQEHLKSVEERLCGYRTVPNSDLDSVGSDPINTCDCITVRTMNILHSEGITRFSDLIKLTEADVLRIRNLGRKRLEEIKEALASRGHNLIPG